MNILNTDIKDIFQNTPLGQYLDANEIDMLIQYNQIKIFEAGEIILQQGKKNDGIYVIIDGTALVTAKVLGQGGAYITTLSSGNLIGEISLIEKGPCATSVIASNQMKCLFISHAYIDMLSNFFPETKYKIYRVIAIETCNRLIDMHAKITSFIKHSAMVSRSLFGEIIKSMTKPSIIHLDEIGLDPNALHRSYFFERFSKAEYDYLINNSELITAPKQTVLIHEGEKSPAIYILLRGAILSSIVEDNKVAKLAVLAPFNLFSSINAVDETFTPVINFSACEKAILIKISENQFRYMQNDNKTLWYKLFDLVCKSLVKLERAADKLDIRLKSELYNR